jgi:HEAT repeat protein
MPLSESAQQGGVHASGRRAHRPGASSPTARIATALLVLAAVAAAGPAGATPAPRLRALLKAARVVVSGDVSAVTSYDDDRVAVVDLAVDKVLKGSLPGEPPFRLSLVELHEGPTRPPLAVGARGIAFLIPASRTSYLAHVLPEGTYYQLVPDFGSFVAAATPADAAQQTAVVERVVASARGEGLDPYAARRLTFDLLAAQSPLLVEDAAAGLADFGTQRELSGEETDTLRAALQRGDLPERVRIALIEAVAKAGVTEAVPALQGIESPAAVAEAAWQALDQLGAPPTDKGLSARLADPEPSIRAAAVRELLRRDGVAAISQVAPVAIQDPDLSVRQASVEALGALKKPEALPPLERVFSESSGELQQATARAIVEVGGPAAVDTLGRLAMAGPDESQRYAVFIIMTMNEPHKDEVLKRIGESHPDEGIREMVTHGLKEPGH